MLARPCGIRGTRSLGGTRVGHSNTGDTGYAVCVKCCYCTGALHLALAVDDGSKGENGCVSL